MVPTERFQAAIPRDILAPDTYAWNGRARAMVQSRAFGAQADHKQ